MNSKSSYSKIGENALNGMETVNAEVFAMMYGSLVTQLLRDYKDISIVNTELFKIGYNMGIRMVEEFLARANIPACASFRDTVTALAEAGFKMFLGISAEVRHSSPPDERCFLVAFNNNPLNEFVELPPSCAALQYSIIICGAITGALRYVS